MTTKKYAAIDVGTNSVRLLLAEKNNNSLINAEKFVNTTRLGSCIDDMGNISQEGIDRTVDAIVKFGEMARGYNCEKIFCIGTAALRNAKNSDVFAAEVKKRANINLDIISGEKEANLGYIGVIGGISLGEDLVLIIDIGGGSTEFILGSSKDIFYKKSLNIGALILTEKFISKMPEKKEELNSLYEYINSEVSSLYNDIKDSKLGELVSVGSNIKLVGIGGTVTQTSAINQKMIKYSREKIHMSVVTKENVINQIRDISALNIEERRNVIGLQPKRAEIIVTGELILKSIMENFGFDDIIISEYDNLEGLLLSD